MYFEQKTLLMQQYSTAMYNIFQYSHHNTIWLTFQTAHSMGGFNCSVSFNNSANIRVMPN